MPEVHVHNVILCSCHVCHDGIALLRDNEVVGGDPVFVCQECDARFTKWYAEELDLAITVN